jgi:hypothetical protein
MAKKKSGSTHNGTKESSTDTDTLKAGYNYAVLQRHDKHLAQLFFTSSICNVYKFNLEDAEWDKLDCQGTLFIYSRATRDGDIGNTESFPYGLVVLNRHNSEDFSLGVMPLSVASRKGTPEMEIKWEEPFIMVQSADGAMYGLWIFNEADRPAVQKTLQWCLDQSL